jgi:hypothetical protein
MAFLTGALLKLAATNTPQPFFGSWVTAGTGFTAPSGQPLTLTLGSACASGNDASQLFTPGEAVLIDPNGANYEAVLIQKVSGNTVILGPSTFTDPYSRTGIVTQFAHIVGGIGTGTFIMPKWKVNGIFTQAEDGNTGTFIYFGNSYAMTAAYRRIVKIAKVTAGSQPTMWMSTETSAGNPYDTSELWAYGTSGDQWSVTFTQA